MEAFKSLIMIIERLLAPDGCPWDQEQTLQSMRGSLLEETAEVIEAINLNENQKIEEELGDLFFNVVFLCKLGEKEQRFTIEDVLKYICAKLIRRHPHIFGDAKVKNSAEVLKQWEEIKKGEKGEHKQSLLDNIPKELPSLVRAQKILKRIKKTDYPLNLPVETAIQTEDDLNKVLMDIISQAQQKGIDAEQVLRSHLALMEKDFRDWEKCAHA
jgi:tetrapyrrole methylase family protein/MazG family protein